MKLMRKIRLQTTLLIILPIIFGFLAGILGYVFVGASDLILPFFGRIYFSGQELGQQVFISQPRSVIVEQNLQLKQIEHDLLPTLVNIYLAKKSGTVLNQAFLPNEILGQGFMLTADGWVVTTAGVVNNLKNNFAAVGYQSRQYNLGDFIKDDATGVVFGRLASSELPVAKLGHSNNLILGQTVVVARQRHQLILAQITRIGYDFKTSQSLIKSSDELKKEIFLNIDLDKTYQGGVVVNLKGEIIGLINDGQVIPVDNFKNIISQVLANQPITRPKLDLKYIDLAQVEGLFHLGEKGALVYGNPPRTSPAYGKLRDGDLIKKVNDIELNIYLGLAEILNNYRAGSRLDLLISRDQKEEVVEVILR